jgi:hypothetical protein
VAAADVVADVVVEIDIHDGTHDKALRAVIRGSESRLRAATSF